MIRGVGPRIRPIAILLLAVSAGLSLAASRASSESASYEVGPGDVLQIAFYAGGKLIRRHPIQLGGCNFAFGEPSGKDREGVFFSSVVKCLSCGLAKLSRSVGCYCGNNFSSRLGISNRSNYQHVGREFEGCSCECACSFPYFDFGGYRIGDGLVSITRYSKFRVRFCGSVQSICRGCPIL